MFKIRIADLNIGIDNKYPYVEELCADYFTDGETNFDVCVTDAEIAAESGGEISEPAYLESLAVYRKISDRITDYNGFLMHGVVLAVDGKGYAFTAPSGTGKTTHAMFWRELFGDKCVIVNGDKPLIRLKGGRCFAYGTPWCGKEGLNANTKVPLDVMFCINRSEENYVMELSPKSALVRLLTAVYRPSEPALFEKTTEYVMMFLKNVRTYDLYCNMSVEAARVAYEHCK